MDSSFTCEACYSACWTCDGGNDDDCLSCDIYAFRRLNFSAGTCECKHRYYEIDSVCGACNPSCEECWGWNYDDCTSCAYNGNSSLVLIDDSNTGECACNDGYFMNYEYSCVLCNP